MGEHARFTRGAHKHASLSELRKFVKIHSLKNLVFKKLWEKKRYEKIDFHRYKSLSRING